MPTETEDVHYLITFNKAIETAEAEGFTVYRGDARTLLLDLDSPADVEHFELLALGLANHLKFRIAERWPSKSGIGEHVVIRLEADMPVRERLMLQACLGSDRIHEMLSLVTGVWQGNEEPTVLFRPPSKPIAVEPWKTLIITDDDAPF